MVKYFLLNEKGEETDEFVAYSDIAIEYGITRGIVAGKFYRAHKKGLNTIMINGNKIIQKREN